MLLHICIPCANVYHTPTCYIYTENELKDQQIISENKKIFIFRRGAAVAADEMTCTCVCVYILPFDSFHFDFFLGFFNYLSWSSFLKPKIPNQQELLNEIFPVKCSMHHRYKAFDTEWKKSNNKSIDSPPFGIASGLH